MPATTESCRSGVANRWQSDACGRNTLVIEPAPDSLPRLPAAEAGRVDVGSYPGYRKLLLSALGYLARQGFVAQPADALDLIQDFFIEGWPGVVARFDSQRDIKPYLFRAFVQFARRRIVRLRQFSDQLVDAHEITLLEVSHATPMIEESTPMVAPANTVTADREKVRAAIDALPERQRLILSEYLANGPRSERAIARRLGVSRFNVHETLLEAIAHVAMKVDQPQQLSDDDWKVAVGLWRDSRSVAELAAHLKRSPVWVRGARDRVREFFADAVRNVHHRGS